MSNVLPLQRPVSYAVVTTIIDTTSPLQDGELVAFQLRNRDQTYGEVLFGHWEAPNGRDHSGHFVKRGSDQECAYVRGLRYSVADLRRGGLKILGSVFIGHLAGQGVVPPPRSAA
jgi:hypothetical protein